MGEWTRCNDGLPYTKTIVESFQYHVNLSTEGLKSLIYRCGNIVFLLSFN